MVLLQTPEDLQNLFPGDGIEVPCGLIGENDLRVVDHGPANGSPLQLTAGELVRFMISSFNQSHLSEEVIHGAPGPIGASVQEVREKDIFLETEDGKKVKELENDTDSIPSKEGQSAIVHLSKIFAIDQDPALIGSVQPAEDFDEGRFPATTLARDGQKFPPGDLEVEVIQSHHRVAPLGIGFRNVDELDEVIGGHNKKSRVTLFLLFLY